MQIILASASPRRREILGLLKIPFEIIVSESEEITEETSPGEVVSDLSNQKARAVYARCEREGRLEENALIIGADTIVFHDDTILGKPADKADACWMLKSLQGDVHQVYTGVTFIIKKGEKVSCHTFYEKTDVSMYEMTEEVLRRYVDTGEPMDKAGSYAVQGIGAVNIKQIAGDYNNVVGLPLAGLYQRLKEHGIDLLEYGLK